MQPVKVIHLMHLGCYDVVRPKSASYYAVRELVERVNINQFFVYPGSDASPETHRQAQRAADEAAHQFALKRADEINAAEQASREQESK